MKDLKQLHGEFRAALAAFREEATTQGFTLTDIGFDHTKNIWLSKRDRAGIAEMLKLNINPEEYCSHLVADGRAFYDREFLD